MSLASGRTKLHTGARNPLVVVPRSLEEARRLLDRLPPPPPGRNIVVPMSLLEKKAKARRCHGCHGWNDEEHVSVPHGANRCTIEHDKRCAGGILGGKDRKGREWKACPVGYVGPAVDVDSGDDDFTDEDGNESEKSESSTSVSLSPTDNYSTTHNITYAPWTGTPYGHSLYTPLSGAHCIAHSSELIPTSGTNSVFTTVSSMPSLSHAVTVSSAYQAPIFSTTPSSSNTDERAALEKLRRECKALEDQTREQARLIEQQRVSAEKMELERQMQLEKEKLAMLKKASRSGTRGQHRSSAGAHAVDSLRQHSNVSSASLAFPNFYEGPNIKEIRKTKGLRNQADRVVESVRTDIASLGHRPTANHDGSLGARPRTIPSHKPNSSTVQQPKSRVQDEFEEFMEFKAWKEQNSAIIADSGSDASPPRVAPNNRQSGRNSRAPAADPPTDPSSSEDESGQPVILVYRRDKNGVKYRSYEPYQTVPNTRNIDKPGKYSWVTDPVSGREYKCVVPASKPSDRSSKQQGHSSGQHRERRVDHRTIRESPETGHRRGLRSPSFSRHHDSERVPGIVPLQEKDGKSDDKKTPTITDWAKNCPVAYAEKIKYEDMNLPIWLWAYVSEILSSRIGLSPDMPKGELEARLQHLLCVLQVALVHSEKTDFNSKGWSIASIYAKRVQQKLDRGLETWDDFKRFGHDPHPSEMFTAKTEVDKKVPPRKTREEERPAGSGKRQCSTWNNCQVERKCQYLVDNPSATKCNRRHDCSYCQEKGYGTFNHQRHFCKKRRDAGEE